jgi:hypothetical protein
MSSQLSPATLLGGWLTILKNMSQLWKLFPYMKWKNKKKVPNHQPVYLYRPGVEHCLAHHVWNM